MKHPSLAALGVALAACGCGGGSGTVDVSLWGEEFIEQQIGPARDAADEGGVRGEVLVDDGRAGLLAVVDEHVHLVAAKRGGLGEEPAHLRREAVLAPVGAPEKLVHVVDDVGLDEIWDQIQRFWDVGRVDGSFDARRRDQQLRWMWSMVSDRLLDAVREHPAVRAVLADVEDDVRAGRLPATVAAERLLAAFASR